MLTGVDAAIELATVTAWLKAWDGSDEEAKAAARTECVNAIMQVWHWLFQHGSVPPAKKPVASVLEHDLRVLRNVLDLWERDPDERESIKVMARKTLAQAIAFFS